MSLFDASLPDATGLQRVILSIDPGKKGALAWIGDDDVLLAVEDMPDAEEVALGVAVAGLLRDHAPYWPTVVWIEKAQAMPDHLKGARQGSASTFKYGKNYGVLLGVVSALGVPVHLVASSSWKAKVPDVTKDKDTSRAKAAQLWPMSAHLFKRKMDDGRAEAALIGWYGGQQRPVGR